ncbi:beta-1,3-galactosyltransferase brn-like [Mytilus trossulus]|uniref:beta-1,3-galactosyltransferase brn-like n=1 Tax=Mytilus trossulus TaxID=6551 RepID=UPI003003D65B
MAILCNRRRYFRVRNFQFKLFTFSISFLFVFVLFQLKGLQNSIYYGGRKSFWNNTDQILSDLKEKGSSNIMPLNSLLLDTAFREDPVKLFEAFDSVELLFVVKSHILNFGKREAIRQTWGHVKQLRIKIIFVLGHLHNMDHFADLESKLHKDIIQLNIEDKYENLVYKTIYALLSLSKLNIETEYVHCVDDDRLVNAINVYDIARQNIAQSDTVMLGFMVNLSRPARTMTSKNYISFEDYPFLYFPSYIIGGTILTNMKTIHMLSIGIQHVRLIHIEDVYIGIVATAFKIEMRHHSGFHPFKKTVLSFSSYLSSPGYDHADALLRDWTLIEQNEKINT